MNNLYVCLAAQNIKKHRRSYVPFMLAGIFVAAVSYILNSLSNNPIIQISAPRHK